MARPLRIDFPNAWHHVMNRARKGTDLFSAKADYQRFLDLLQETAELFNINVAAFCLMPNHYHLMVQTPDANLSRCMRHLNGVYTQKYNLSHGCDGTLFRGRYRSILVDADSYVLQLVRYIHRNPLKAGLVKHLDQYAWSSYKGYISNSRQWCWLYKDFVLQMLTEHSGSQIPAFKQFMAQQQDEELVNVFERKSQPSMIGSQEFIDRIKGVFFKTKKDNEIPASKGLAPDVDRIISEVSRYYGEKPTAVTAVRRGIENEPRDAAIYLIRSMRSEPLMKIGALFGLNRYSSVSGAVMRAKTKLKNDGGFKQRLNHIKDNILKRQK
jgi:REP element-mobilizing transposase RayT/succinate dehydrogenase flavin-adding protein (antitoxin of CptAB toxin-antitoxin module)